MEVPIRGQVRTGILIWDSRAEYLGLMPEYIEREAARFAIINWAEWQSWEYMDKVKAAAHYLINLQIGHHQQDAIAREENRRANEQRNGKR